MISLELILLLLPSHTNYNNCDWYVVITMIRRWKNCFKASSLIYFHIMSQTNTTVKSEFKYQKNSMSHGHYFTKPLNSNIQLTVLSK